MKIGDKVKMTPRGFRFYSNLNITFDLGSVGKVMGERHFVTSVCSLFAIHGTGVVKEFNSINEPYIEWRFSINGTYYYYTHYYDPKDVRKLTFWEKLVEYFKC